MLKKDNQEKCVQETMRLEDRHVYGGVRLNETRGDHNDIQIMAPPSREDLSEWYNKQPDRRISLSWILSVSRVSVSAIT